MKIEQYKLCYLVQDVDEYTCEFLKDVYYKINKQVGYIIFKL